MKLPETRVINCPECDSRIRVSVRDGRGSYRSRQPRDRPARRLEGAVMQEQIEYVEFWLMLASALVILAAIIWGLLRLPIRTAS